MDTKIFKCEVYSVGALIANNAVGYPLLNEGPSFLSAHLEIDQEFGGCGFLMRFMMVF